MCIAYIAILTLFCVRLNVTPKTVFWLFNSYQLVFIDIFHGLVIPWRMKIPWRTPQQKERPSQFYVLKPPELRIGRFDKMATQRPAPPPPPPFYFLFFKEHKIYPVEEYITGEYQGADKYC